MNEPASIANVTSRISQPVFVSYASADRKQALAMCQAVERRGISCWISTRDVQAGENYQEAIVRAIRDARAMVLVFSRAANDSDEIKKELSLASRFRIPVIAVRIEDVEPNDAFAYELSTRQWIDAFEGRDKALALVAERLEHLGGGADTAAPATRGPVRGAGFRRLPFRPLLAVLFAALVLAGLAAWLMLRPSSAAAHTMQVRMAGFSKLSPNLPATLPDAIRDQIISALSTDGLITPLTTSAPAPGNGPAYALGGSISNDGDKVKVIARLTNERTGATLWSDTFTYEAARISHVPEWTAVDTTMIVRCGLFGASTYPKALPDGVVSDYLHFCGASDAARRLDLARKVVATTPDFSWGWSAVETAAQDVADSMSPPPPKGDSLWQESAAAADTALRLDPRNSEALALKSFLLDGRDLIGREALFKAALAARPLACGCEHHYYANFLWEVGRINDAVAQYRRAVAAQPVNPQSERVLAEVLLIAGRSDEAKAHLEAAAERDDDPASSEMTSVELAPTTGDYAAAIRALHDPKLRLPDATRSAMLASFQAIVSGDDAAKRAAAIQAAALPLNPSRYPITLLGALGANADALQLIEAHAQLHAPRMWLWLPSMAGALRDRSFPAVAERLGLMRYWKTTHTKPDVCSAKDPPPFCQMI